MNCRETPISLTNTQYTDRHFRYIEFLDTAGNGCILQRSCIYPNIRLGLKDTTMNLGPLQARMIKEYAIRVVDGFDCNGIEFEENLGNIWRINKTPDMCINFSLYRRNPQLVLDRLILRRRCIMEVSQKQLHDIISAFDDMFGFDWMND
ncbi:MAG: hypothetical protein EOP45_17010 [Sphingobacteriaceae bacterium]|nr:MAG: hypothetical protein EOP45_17010 [Sphingobacteriaceae bacterium]